MTNALVLTAYSGTALVNEPGLKLAEGLSFSTIYPGGLFGSCSFYVPRDASRPWLLTEGNKLVVRNGIHTVWEGRVTSIGINLQQGDQGLNVMALGYWADVMMPRTWRKRWADTRVGGDVMVKGEDVATEDFWEVEQDFGHLEIFPKETAFTNGDYLAVVYTMPTGQTVKRITYGYDFDEDTQSWEQVIWDPVAGAAVSGSSITATGTGTHDLTLATPRQVVEFRMYAKSNLTATYAKKVKSEWEDLVIYSETGAINLTEICKDVRGHVTELSADESLIASNTLSLVPFIADGETLADIITRAAAYGDSSYNSWAVGIRESDLSSDGKPVLFAEAYPALTDYDYAVRFDEPNLSAPFQAERDISDVRNYIIVEYNDSSGRTVVLTPDDDATLKDTVSITAYGERHQVIRIETASAATAANYGRRLLAARKDPQWRVSSSINITGYVRGKGNLIYPASEIRAGKRIKVENFLSDINGSGLTLLITGTQYTDDTETCRVSVGQPDTLDAWLAQNG
jgi:hypothetical protein